MPKKKQTNRVSPQKQALDVYEQEIEDNYDSLKPIVNQKTMIANLTMAAKNHIQKKKPITIRLSIEDLEAIKIKADKCGLPYQTYLNMIIHKDVTKNK